MSGAYLYEDISEFLDSAMWTGGKARAQVPLHKWFGWVYISEFNSFKRDKYLNPDDVPNLKFKIGYTLKIAQRTEALEASTNTNNKVQHSSTIIYSWSLPKPYLFETKIKQFLKAFIHKDSMEENTSGKSEITHGLTLETLIHVIQLCVLEQCLEHCFLNCANNDTLKEQLQSHLRSPPDVIIENKVRYSGQMISKNVIKEFNVDEIWGEILPDGSAKYPVGYDAGKGQFVQWVFNAGMLDKRKENPNLKDNDTIADDSITEDRSESTIPDPFFVGECVFTAYQSVPMPCRIIGYGLGIHLGQYVVEWIEHKVKNEVMTFPVDRDSRYRVWHDISGKPALHEFKLPKDIQSWRGARRNQVRPDPRRWPRDTERKKRTPDNETKEQEVEPVQEVVQKPKKEVGMTMEEAIRDLKVNTIVQKIKGNNKGTMAVVTKVPSSQSRSGKFAIDGNAQRNQKPGTWKIVSTRKR
mgnify:CR=1 FL=1|tara:strand:- start:6073 stop:7476 length:1404 start_codon:yes stop_codon:yes gene_type:complete